MDRPKSLLLKLHGSVNWRSRLGEAASRGPAALLHHESWMPRRSQLQYEDREIESHLEPDAFIVPPVLEKAGLGLHPALRVIWAAAKQKLEKASTVIFIGYSLPQTDLAARTLFRETLGDRKCHVQVLDYSPNMHPKPTLVEAYRAVCRDIGEDCFDWGGAKARIESKFSRAPNA